MLEDMGIQTKNADGSIRSLTEVMTDLSIATRGSNDQTKQTDGLRNPLKYDADPDKQADVEQKDMESKIRNLDDSENVKSEKPDEKGDASQTAPAGLSVQLSYGSGTESGPTGAGGYRDQEAGRIDAEEEDDKDSPFV